jgi:type IV fimbrial biogenesis protein FimT
MSTNPFLRVMDWRLRQSACRGFTMVELMVTLVVLAILMAVAAPNLVTFINNSRLRSTHGELTSALTLARSEATKRGTSVVVEALAPTAGAEFSGGWRVFEDTNGNGIFDEPEAKVVRRYPALSGNQRFGTEGGVSSVAFGPRGFLKNATPIVFHLCGQAGFAQGYRILLEPVGLADVSEERTCT